MNISLTKSDNVEDPSSSGNLGCTNRSNNNNNNDNSTKLEPVNVGTYIVIQEDIDPNTYDDEEDDSKPLILSKTNRRRRRQRLVDSKNHQPQPQSQPQEPHTSLRSYILALSFSITLLVFWLLDSIKDPTFVLLVDGDLQRHQPWAKMFSMIGNIGILILLEVTSHHNNDKENDPSFSHCIEEEEEAPPMENTTEIIMNPHHFHKMSIHTERNYHKLKDNLSKQQHAIPIIIFQIIGTIYIFTLLFISFFLSKYLDWNIVSNTNNTLSLSSNGTIHENSTSSSSTMMITLNQNNNNNHVVGWYILGYFMYFIIESFGSISIVTFWSFTDTNLTISMAKRSYGLIIATGQIGAIAGSTLATLEKISTSTKLCIACLGIGLQMILIKIYGYWFPTSMLQEEEEENYGVQQNPWRIQNPFEGKMSMQDRDIFTRLNKYMSGILLIFKHHYLLLILGVSCLHEVSLTCLDYELKLMGLAKYESRVSFMTFMGRYGQLTNILSFLLSYFAFPYLMKSYGVKKTLRIFPTLLIAINFLTYIAMPENLTVLFICLSLLKAMTYSINEPTHEILYIPTSNVIKFKAKFWIDVVGARIAKGIGSFINTYAGNLDRAIQYGSLPSIATALGLFIACYAVGLEFETVTRHETIGY